jgi:hypothetical protein
MGGKSQKAPVRESEKDMAHKKCHVSTLANTGRGSIHKKCSLPYFCYRSSCVRIGNQQYKQSPCRLFALSVTRKKETRIHQCNAGPMRWLRVPIFNSTAIHLPKTADCWLFYYVRCSGRKKDETRLTKLIAELLN